MANPIEATQRAGSAGGTRRALFGLALVGYGLLVLIGLTPHESPWLALAGMAAGALLLWKGLPRVRVARRRLVAAIGATAALGTLAYNVVRGSGLGLPEWATVAYGVALVTASTALGRKVGRTDVGTLVAWSFPLILAPLAMFSLNAAFTQGGGTAASPAVHVLVVWPTALLMRASGTPVELLGNNMLLTTPRGGLSLGVGLVCAGLYPMILFAGLLGLHAWRTDMPRRRFLKHLCIGLAALWLLNVVRLLILAHVGIQWGGAVLQTTHAHLGWVLFLLFMAGYLAIAARSGRRAKPQGTTV